MGVGIRIEKNLAPSYSGTTTTERFIYLDKLNLVKFAFGDLVLGLSQFLLLLQLPQ